MGKYLVFTSNNARVVYTDDPSKLCGRVLEEWDQSKVMGLPPHFWKYSPDGILEPMSARERDIRMAEHEANGVDNQVYLVGTNCDDGPEPTRAWPLWLVLPGSLALIVVLMKLLGVLNV